MIGQSLFHTLMPVIADVIGATVGSTHRAGGLRVSLTTTDDQRERNVT